MSRQHTLRHVPSLPFQRNGFLTGQVVLSSLYSAAELLRKIHIAFMKLVVEIYTEV